MNKLFGIVLAFFVLASCSKTEPPPPQVSPPPVNTLAPVQVQPEKPKFIGTRVGPLLASVFVLDDILVSHDAEVTIPPQQPSGPLTPTIPLPPKIVPRQSSVQISVTLSNDNDRALDLNRDFNFESNWLFLVIITDKNGNRVFQREKELQGVGGWDVADVKKFAVSWPVSANMVGEYRVTVKFGFGGQLTAMTRLR
jgi:hypothetical protein